MLRKILTRPQLKLLKCFNQPVYAQQMYQKWKQDVQSVDKQWQDYFNKNPNQAQNNVDDANLFGIFQLIKAYQNRGNEIATLDPLNLDEIKISGLRNLKAPVQMDIESHGFKESDLDKEIYLNDINIPLHDIAHFLQKQQVWTLREIVKELESIYTKNIGYQFQHIPHPQEKLWLRQYIETPNKFKLDEQKKITTYKTLLKNDVFTNFVKNKWNTSKRFGLEGCDTLITGLSQLTYCAAQDNVNDLIFAMPHRGRLNILTQILHKPFEKVFCEFNDVRVNTEQELSVQGFSGDVKYHLGTTHDKYFKSFDHSVRMTIIPNPSHLETVDPVLYGKTRAIQDIEKDETKDKAIGILMHGDAAFAGQGVVYETLQMQNLKSFCVGGTIHIIINNQIGFTTAPQQSRSSQYCSDVAKAIGAPIIHVNADDPESVTSVMQLAYDFRKQFKKDIVIDLIGYRRYGHNEVDQPSFTQPLMYEVINKTKPVCQKFEEQLISEGIITKEFVKQTTQQYTQLLNQSFEKSKNMKSIQNEWKPKKWQEIRQVKIDSKTPRGQGLNLEYLKSLFNKIIQYPENFLINAQVKKIFEARQKTIQEGKGIDFATAESLAFASLIEEGYNVRLSGQDVQRGTFSHRHNIIHDQQQKQFYQMISQNLLPKDQQDRCFIHNSHLSEYGVLGFEYGYSITNPNVLNIWEAQFGDFSNGCQVIIDNYIASGESKWATNSGLILSLPHGMDGQGPEHSSARMERFLQLCDDDAQLILKKEDIEKQIKNTNLQILQCSTSANYFLALRRQMRRDYRKPLIMFNSKRLLRFRNACSSIEEFGEEVIFNRVYGEQSNDLVPDDQIKKVIICSGQFYYDILEKRTSSGIKDVAIVRIEQMAPFPFLNLIKVIQNYKNAKFVFAQEEHKNYGPWSYVEQRIKNTLIHLKQKEQLVNCDIEYAGRRIGSTAAAGSMKVHQIELKNLLNELFP